MPRQEVGRLVALMPGVEHRLLPENRTQRKIRPTQLIFHSIVGSAEGAYRYFRDGTNLESTFIVAKSGKIIQLMDTERQADANFRANVRAGSVETEDNGDPDKDPWTSAQLRSLLRIARFYHEHHDVPRRQCPRWDAAGYGYHRLFPSQWTSVKGKGLRRSTPIPTPDGIRALGSLRVGDQVFDESGDPTRITEISDYTPRAVYRITFNDGLEVIADDAHQWVTYTLGERGAYFRRDRPRDQHRGPKPVGFPENWAAGRTVRTTGDILAGIRGGGSHASHVIPLAGPLRFPRVDLPLDPYLLGVWLGDGTSVRGDIASSVDGADPNRSDARIIAQAFLEAGFRLGAWWPGKSENALSFKVIGLRPILRALDVLRNKHVPENYLRASQQQRLSLLQGLMDTDGSVSVEGQAEFVSSNERLADAVCWLACSLGQKAVKCKDTAWLNGVDHGPRYRVRWHATAPVFRLPRKLRRLRPIASSKVFGRKIVAIEETLLEPMRCLTVDSPNSMYLITESCLPTHNTCPGDIRVRQYRDTILPAIISGRFDGPGQGDDAEVLSAEAQRWLNAKFSDVNQRVIDRTGLVYNLINTKAGDILNRLDVVGADAKAARVAAEQAVALLEQLQARVAALEAQRGAIDLAGLEAEPSSDQR